jgi:hypothetical protein
MGEPGWPMGTPLPPGSATIISGSSDTRLARSRTNVGEISWSRKSGLPWSIASETCSLAVGGRRGGAPHHEEVQAGKGFDALAQRLDELLRGVLAALQLLSGSQQGGCQRRHQPGDETSEGLRERAFEGRARANGLHTWRHASRYSALAVSFARRSSSGTSFAWHRSVILSEARP